MLAILSLFCCLVRPSFVIKAVKDILGRHAASLVNVLVRCACALLLGLHTISRLLLLLIATLPEPRRGAASVDRRSEGEEL